ncbi:nucleoside triphosphate hydrolase [Rhizobium glycinendophyticum]|uniref:Nucleoside triphosphate hydrolase n=1 Tax=Rhizobium glycinendophyticum TaxID=2589807 RepID=A0A504U8L3_9HYPH|nr:nucleoside triphosphate hydrolase [Rhizobium glycinendophyticum]TPP09690.1 nucleoside triphosphate hydrolase [Rhizobium glycinendophyticum]
MSMTVEQLADEIIKRAEGSARFLVGIAGPPGGGKSTLAEALFAHLKAIGEAPAVLPMDGFHLDNRLLIERGLLSRKGAPETFDVRGLRDILMAVRSGGEVLVPVFDRDRELAICAARCIAAEDRIILVEGNYVLLDREPWRPIASSFDLTVMVAPEEDELERRLVARWVHYGLSQDEIRAKVEDNDLPNGRLVLSASHPADITLRFG